MDYFKKIEEIVENQNGTLLSVYGNIIIHKIAA